MSCPSRTGSWSASGTWSCPAIRGYKDVAAALSSAVKAHPIANVYRHYERSVGTDKNFEQLVTGQRAWEHFYVTLPATVVMDKRSIPTKLGEYREAHQMLTRALATISDDAIDTVLELISQNSIYRGAEHKGLVTAFKDMRKKCLAFFGLPKDLFIWSVAASGSSAVTGIRNSVIGTLLVNLSEGVPIERAVASFEAKVAPTNYKRPTALVTKAMIEAAKKSRTWACSVPWSAGTPPLMTSRLATSSSPARTLAAP